MNSIILAQYTLVNNGMDINDCNGQRKSVGDWGGKDPDTKLKMCAEAVSADSSCGNSFFFESDIGACFCEGKGATCKRYNDNYIDEYILERGTKINQIFHTTTVQIIYIYICIHEYIYT